MTDLEKAEHIVRNHEANKELMELGFGCEVEYAEEQFIYVSDGMAGLATIWNKRCSAIHKRFSEVKILGKPAHLEHYLGVLPKEASFWFVQLNGTDYLCYQAERKEMFRFNLTTGKPATEKDAKEFIKLVS